MFINKLLFKVHFLSLTFGVVKDILPCRLVDQTRSIRFQNLLVHVIRTLQLKMKRHFIQLSPMFFNRRRFFHW